MYYMYRVGEQYYLWKVPVCMSGISVKNSWANCSPGHRLHITVKYRTTVVKMKGRSEGKDHMIQSAADILGKVHKWGGGGGDCISFLTSDWRPK